MEHFKTLSSYLDYLGLPRPEHPMLSIFNSKGEGYLPCPRESSPPITNDCYSISFKKRTFKNKLKNYLNVCRKYGFI